MPLLLDIFKLSGFSPLKCAIMCVQSNSENEFMEAILEDQKVRAGACDITNAWSRACLCFSQCGKALAKSAAVSPSIQSH